MKFVEIEINDNVVEKGTYNLVELIKKMPKSFYEKWEQHLENTSKTPQELYESNYHLEFKSYDGWRTIYITKNEKIIGEMGVYYLPKDGYFFSGTADCNFCKKGGTDYNYSRYNLRRFIDLDLSKRIKLKSVNYKEEECEECNQGTIEKYTSDYIVGTQEDLVFVEKIKYYDQFQYFKGSELRLEDKEKSNE